MLRNRQAVVMWWGIHWLLRAWLNLVAVPDRRIANVLVIVMRKVKKKTAGVRDTERKNRQDFVLPIFILETEGRLPWLLRGIEFA